MNKISIKWRNLVDRQFNFKTIAKNQDTITSPSKIKCEEFKFYATRRGVKFYLTNGLYISSFDLIKRLRFLIYTGLSDIQTPRVVSGHENEQKFLKSMGSQTTLIR